MARGTKRRMTGIAEDEGTADNIALQVQLVREVSEHKRRRRRSVNGVNVGLNDVGEDELRRDRLSRDRRPVATPDPNLSETARGEYG